MAIRVMRMKLKCGTILVSIRRRPFSVACLNVLVLLEDTTTSCVIDFTGRRCSWLGLRERVSRCKEHRRRFSMVITYFGWFIIRFLTFPRRITVVDEVASALASQASRTNA